MYVKLKMYTTGSCGQLEKLTNRTKPLHHVQFPARFFHLEHPTEGHILVDTGYATHFRTATSRFPYKLYAILTPIHFSDEQSAASQLQRRGIQPSEIRKILITHFHADHIAGLKDFPNATFLCSRRGYESIRGQSGLLALKKAFIPSLLPDDFESRLSFIEDYAVSQDSSIGQQLAVFETEIYDIFHDGTVVAFDLSGHAEGQMGFLCRAEQRQVLLAADGAWDSAAIRENSPPMRVTSLILSDRSEYLETLHKLHQFHITQPTVQLIPFHCREVEGLE